MADLEQALERLADEGINWVAHVHCSAAPDRLPGGEGRHRDAHVLLLLSLGPRFAERTDYGEASSHPFDTRSVELVERLLRPALGDHDAALLYPGGASIDLRRWLALARAQYPAPFGTGIRPECGPWLAVRAALLAVLRPAERAVLATRYPPLPPDRSPCERCPERPCQAACPAGAVTAGDFDLGSCVGERLREGSACARSCAARLACPVGSDSRYGPTQLDYHYGVSLAQLRLHATAPPGRK